jgi:hypothetical protein
MMFVLLLAAAGCGQIDKQELAYRNSYRTTWDQTVAATRSGQKSADAAYTAGNVDAVVAAYKKLAAYYSASQTASAKKKPPLGYEKMAGLSQAYYTDGAAYYTKVASVVESTGGNYGLTQEAEIKAARSVWDAAAKKLARELAVKRFKLG